MGWGTTFNPEVYINKMIFDSVEQLQDVIDDHESYLRSAEEDMLICSALSPKDYKESDEDDVVFMIRRKFKDTLEFYRETLDTLHLLYQLKEHIDNGGTYIKG